MKLDCSTEPEVANSHSSEERDGCLSPGDIGLCWNPSRVFLNLFDVSNVKSGKYKINLTRLDKFVVKGSCLNLVFTVCFKVKFLSGQYLKT